MFDGINSALIFSYFLVFCRLGSGIMLLPGLSESYMSPKSRLVAALALSGLVLPTVQNILPKLPSSGIELALMAVSEIIIGLFIGSMAKILMSTLHVTGMIVSQNIGLASASMFDPSQSSQGSEIGVFLVFIAILIVFQTDLHHVFIKGLVDSYRIFDPKDSLPLSGFAETMGKIASESFMVGIKLAAPQIVVGLIFYIGSGVMARLMPQMQVFFVLMPIQVTLGFFIFMVTLSACMISFMNYFAEAISNYTQYTQ